MTNEEILLGFKKLKMNVDNENKFSSDYYCNNMSPEFEDLKECGILKDCINTTYTNKTVY